MIGFDKMMGFYYKGMVDGVGKGVFILHHLCTTILFANKLARLELSILQISKEVHFRESPYRYKLAYLIIEYTFFILDIALGQTIYK